MHRSGPQRAMKSKLPSPKEIARERQAGPAPKIAAVCLHFVVVFLVFSIWLVNPSPSRVLLYGGLICLPAYLCMAWMESRSTPLRINPLSFYLAWYSISLGASAIYMSSQIAHNRAVRFAVTVISPGDIVAGYIIFLSGSLMLHLGMRLRSPRPARGDLAAIGHRAPYVYVIFGLGVLRIIFPGAFAPLGSFGGCLVFGAIAGLSAFALHPYFRRRLGPEVFWSALLIGTLVLIVLELHSGSKAYIMYAFVPLAWRFLLDNSLRRFLPVLLGGLAVFYLAVVAPVIMASRLIRLQPGESRVQPILTEFSRRFGGGGGAVSASQLGGQQHAFLSRMFDSTSTGYFVGQVRNSGLLEGKTMSYIAYAFIPRILWPQKPNVSRGAWFDAYIGQARSAKEATTSLGMTATGELYWNFGLPGVLLGMFVIGLMEGQLWRLAGSDPRSSPIRMLLYVTQIFAMPDMAEAVSVVTSLVATWLIFRTLLLLTEPRRRQQRRRIHFPGRSYAYNPAE